MKKPKQDIKSMVTLERKLRKATTSLKLVNAKYRNALERIDTLEKEMSGVLKLTHKVRVKKIAPRKRTINGDAVAVIVMSDWHYEEQVRAEDVNGLNEYNLKIADKRIETAWQNSLKLIRAADRDNDVNTIVIALLGDFVSSNIHDELLEINQLAPAHAIYAVQKRIISGIDFLLKNTNKNIVVHCVSGNHTRMTKRIRHSTFTGNSLEDFMYHNIEQYYALQKRIKFNIPTGYLSYMDILGLTVRFHHGHAIRYQGGVGGIYIPANKAIAQWNKGNRADIDVFGHFHQLKDGGQFLINGSLIGYNPYAMSIKADFEEPKQLFFLINKHGRTGYTKIVV